MQQNQIGVLEWLVLTPWMMMETCLRSRLCDGCLQVVVKLPLCHVMSPSYHWFVVSTDTDRGIAVLGRILDTVLQRSQINRATEQLIRTLVHVF